MATFVNTHEWQPKTLEIVMKQLFKKSHPYLLSKYCSALTPFGIVQVFFNRNTGEALYFNPTYENCPDKFPQKEKVLADEGGQPFFYHGMDIGRKCKVYAKDCTIIESGISPKLNAAKIAEILMQ